MRMETSIIICLVVSFVAILLSLVNLVFNVVAFVELRSFMKSTHKVEYLPLDPMGLSEAEKSVDDIMKKDLGLGE
jgi:hypothetical protein